MQEGKTIGQLMEEMRQKAGAQNYHGHDYMDLQRFFEWDLSADGWLFGFWFHSEYL